MYYNIRQSKGPDNSVKIQINVSYLIQKSILEIKTESQAVAKRWGVLGVITPSRISG